MISHRGTDKHGHDIWLVQVDAGRRPDGKRHRLHATVHGTRRQAEQMERKLQAEADQLVCAAQPITLAAWAEDYLASAHKRGRAPRTLAEYRRMLDTRILPALGSLRLDRLQSADIARFMRHLAEQQHARCEGPISAAAQIKYYRLLSSMLQEAVYCGLMPINPVRQVRPPQIERYRARYYDAADVGQLWTALQGEPIMWRAIVATALLLGIRRGELVALRWGDVDWTRRVVRIERAAYSVTGSPQRVRAPKTATSLRAIDLPDALADILQSWRQEQGGADDDYICAEPHSRGLSWLDIDTPTRWFWAFTRRRGLPPLNLHGLRHTYATILLDAGVALPTVAELAGHSTPTTTARIYTHPTSAQRDLAREAVASLLPTNPPTPVGNEADEEV